MTPPKSTAELRMFLLEQMVAISEGQQDPAQAKAICNYAQQIYNTVALEVKYSAAKLKAGENGIESVPLS